MGLPGGSVRWGTLFQRDEVDALVLLSGPPPVDETDFTCGVLCLLNWRKDHWEFRQTLGPQTDYELRHRSLWPQHIVQATRRADVAGNVDRTSWRYDDKPRQFVPTGWDHWGPFHVMGDYICFQRGVERRGNNDTRWIYKLKHGQMGDLVAAWNMDCQTAVLPAPFTITFREGKTGTLKHWCFKQIEEGENDGKPDHWAISVTSHEEGSKGTDKAAAELWRPHDDSVDPALYFFEQLTGIDADILQTWEPQVHWSDHLAAPTGKKVPTKVTGNPEIAARLQWPAPTKVHP